MGKRNRVSNDNDQTMDNVADQTEEYISKKLKKSNGSIEENEATISEDVTVVEQESNENDAVNNEIIPRTRRDMIQLPYDEKLKFVSIIAQPMAGKKLAKKIFKLMRKASKQSRKEQLRIGLKEVQLRIRKGERGIIVFAGDVTPIEIMCHLPAICEEKDIPYIYVPFRTDISSAIGVRRPALMVLIKPHEEYKELYDECEMKIREVMLEFLKKI